MPPAARTEALVFVVNVSPAPIVPLAVHAITKGHVAVPAARILLADRAPITISVAPIVVGPTAPAIEPARLNEKERPPARGLFFILEGGMILLRTQ